MITAAALLTAGKTFAASADGRLDGLMVQRSCEHSSMSPTVAIRPGVSTSAVGQTCIGQLFQAGHYCDL